MATRKHRKSKKSAKRFRRTRSKRQRGGGPGDEKKDKAYEVLHELKSDNKISQSKLNEMFFTYCKNGILPATIEMLLSKTIDVNMVDDKGNTPLIVASDYGHTKIVKILLNNGANPHIENNAGWTTIDFAVGFLIEQGLTQKQIIESDLFTLLSKAGGRPGKAFHDMYKPHLSTGAKKHIPTPPGIDDKSGGKRKSRRYKKTKRKTRSKRQRGGTINNDLLYASSNGRTELVAMLLEEGADVNVKDNGGNTALIKASLGGHLEIVARLLEKDANVNARSNAGNTALIWASIQGHTETAAMLLENGADVNEENHRGLSALSAAGLKGHSETVVMLLEKGANVHGTDEQGSTAIILASRKGHTETVKVLEDYIKNKENKATTMASVTEYKRPNISSFSTLAYHQVPTDVDTYINLHPGTMRRPYGKLGGKRRTKRTKRKSRSARRKSHRK
jgi:ankyrin repeat protein